MGKNQYSDKDKGTALAFLDFRTAQTGDKNIKRAAELLEIPERTLNDWDNNRGLSADVASIREESKKNLADLIIEKVRVMIAATDGKVPNASLQQNWTSIGIAVDKMQLLTGKPTSISEDVTPTADQLELIRKLKAERGEESISDNN